ncbi:MAG: hypothetical protein FWD91_07835, partial [Treponema sp.]|nr:hypothetical protein [Treponema sp.]
MARGKKPSIYTDRGTIGSFDELDEYGVWVKSEPQELSLGETGASTDAAEFPDETDALNLDLPDLDTLPELDNLPDLDEFQKDFQLGDSSHAATGNSGTDAAEFSLDFDSAEDLLAEESENESGSEEKSGSVVFEDDFSLPDLDAVLAEDFPPDTSDDDDNGDLNLDIDQASIDQVSNEMSELAIEQLIAAPMEMQSEPEPFAEEEISGAMLDSELRSSPESINLSTQLLMKIADELSSIRNELSKMKREFSAISGGSAPTPEQEDEKIALSGDEMSNLLGDDPASALVDTNTETLGEAMLSGEEESGLADDEEKIALSEDELNNILSTANLAAANNLDTTDITQESEAMNEDVDYEADALEELAELPDDADFSLDDLGTDTIGIEESTSEEVDTGIDPLELEPVEIGELTSSEEILSEELLSAELPVEEDMSEDFDRPVFSDDELEKLDKILQDGVEPITSAPDDKDSQYLTSEVDDIPPMDILS